jgi:gamma-glutamyltranspeptidase
MSYTIGPEKAPPDASAGTVVYRSKMHKGIQAEAIQGAVVAEWCAMGHNVVHSPHSFEPIMSRAHVISTVGGKMRGGADPLGAAGVG